MSTYANSFSLLYISSFIYIVSFILVVAMSCFSETRRNNNIFLHILSIIFLAIVPIVNTIAAVIICYEVLSDSYRNFKDNKEFEEINRKYTKT